MAAMVGVALIKKPDVISVPMCLFRQSTYLTIVLKRSLTNLFANWCGSEARTLSGVLRKALQQSGDRGTVWRFL